MTIIPLIAMQEYLAEGEETPSERRARLAREAEERDRARLAGDLHVWAGSAHAELCLQARRRG